MPDTTSLIPGLLAVVFIATVIVVANSLFLPQAGVLPTIESGSSTITGLAFTIGSNFFTDDYGDTTGISVQNNVTVLGGTVSPAGATGGGEIDPNSSVGNGLVALWHFNGNASDSVGGFNGTLFDNTDCSISGRFGQACNFDGNGDYIKFGDPDF
ncbi:MAG: hypothetical protein HYW50_03570, partial [Candidatus Diapherotrites archaeon]|nr:hypothetical protein [Candidatus Diapherotrites archaeon]